MTGVMHTMYNLNLNYFIADIQVSIAVENATIAAYEAGVLGLFC